MEKYQDKWHKGKVIEKGVRECDKRYKIIRSFVSQYKRPFTVLDIGAGFAYFSLRLAEDFDCTAVAIDFDPRLPEILEQNNNSKVILFYKRVSLKELRDLAEAEHFDVVLALSVIHHIGPSFHEALEVFKSLGDHLIMEISIESKACGQKVLREAEIPKGAKILGYGKSHLSFFGKRPIFVISSPKENISTPYIHADPSRDLRIKIKSDFFNKRVAWESKKEPEREWFRGINFQTYLKMAGVYPSRSKIVDMLIKHGLPRKKHNDIEPWNIILQGDKVVFIDYNHNISLHGKNDRECFDSLMKSLTVW